MAKKLIVEIVGDSSSFTKATKNAQIHTTELGTRLSALTKTAVLAGAALGAAGMVAGAKKAIDAASDLSEQMNKASVVFRGSEKDILAWSKSTATSLGISQREALAAASTFGNLLVPMGFARDQAEGMSKKFVQLAADLASFNNASPADTLEALRSGLAGETEPLRKFGIFLSQARVQQELMAAGVKVNAQNITAAQKAWATYRIIMKDSADAQGDFGRTSGGLANQQRILKASIDNFLATVGKALLPTVLQVTKQLNGWISNTENQRRVQKDLNAVIDTARGLIQDFTPFVKGAANAAKTFSDNVGGAKKAIEILAGAFAAYKITSMMTGFSNSTKNATTNTGRLATNLRGLSKIGPIVLTIAFQFRDFKGALSKRLQDDFNSGGLDGMFGLTGTSGYGTGAVGAITAGTPAFKSQQKKILSFAKTYGPGSGITYTWGGVSPVTGFDCSGYLMAAYAAAGINIPHNTVAQFNDPNALDTTGRELPGDGVYFKTDGPGGPPQHVGIYIGGGQFIEYFSQGKPAKVNSLGAKGGYMGARRWLKIKSSGGGGGTRSGGSAPSATPPTSGLSPHTTKAATSFQIPLSIQTGIANAALSPSTADDLKWFKRARDWINAHMPKGGDMKVQALEALKGFEDDIKGIEKAGIDKRKAQEDAANKRQQERLKNHLARMKQIIERNRNVFEDAFSDLASKAFDAFDRESARGLAAIAAQYGAETDAEKALREFRAARDAEQRSQERADAMAIEDPVERAARLRELDLQDQEADLEAKADASRTARDKEQTDAENAYNDMRALQRDQLDAWLREQEGKLETGKTQWDGFWAELVKKAGIAGTDVASAFWQQFAAAGGGAAAALGGLTSAQVAKAVVPVGGSTGGSSSTGYVVGGILVQPPKLAAGGIVRKPTLAMIGERGPEAVVPLGAGGMPSVNVTINGWVGNDQEIAERVRSELIKIGRRNSNNLFGGMS